ncbi:MAG: hypothetical protein ACRDVC_06845 [Acidimicrobiales bacterium]
MLALSTDPHICTPIRPRHFAPARTAVSALTDVAFQHVRDDGRRRHPGRSSTYLCIANASVCTDVGISRHRLFVPSVVRIYGLI